MKKVTCFIIAPLKAGYVIDQRCLDSVIGQDYDNFDILIHYEKPEIYTVADFPTCGPGLIPLPEWAINLYKNCSFNRNVARKMALTTDAEYFLVLDSDMCLPKNAIKSFMLQAGADRKTTHTFAKFDGTPIPAGTPIPEKHIQGGWYPIFGHDDNALLFYPCGEFVKDNTAQRYYQPQPSLTRVDYCGVGCVFMTRKSLEDIHFEPGFDTWSWTADSDSIMYAGECGAFGNSAYEKGYDMYMNGDVICEHIKEPVCQTQSQ